MYSVCTDGVDSAGNMKSLALNLWGNCLKKQDDSMDHDFYHSTARLGASVLQSSTVFSRSSAQALSSKLHLSSWVALYTRNIGHSVADENFACNFGECLRIISPLGRRNGDSGITLSGLPPASAL